MKNKTLAAWLAFADQLGPGVELALVGERGDAPKIALRAQLEQGQPANQLDSPVGPDEHGGHSIGI